MNEKRIKLENKLMNRIGKSAITKDNHKMGIITNFTIDVIEEGTPEARLTVNYLISYGEGKNAVLRLVNENIVVILNETHK